MVKVMKARSLCRLEYKYGRYPTTGSYRIEAVGASGGYDIGTNSHLYRGRGARMIGTFEFNRGDVIKILIGQEGGINRQHHIQAPGEVELLSLPTTTPP